MTERVPCRFFLQGYCAYGDGCRFLHDNSQAAAPQHGNGHTGNQQVCRFFLNGHCAFGDSCRNLHPANGQQGGAGRGGQRHTPSNGASAGYSSARQGGSSGNSAGPPDSGAPNWDDFMDPDEMDEFERWQAEQLDLELQQQMGGWEDMEDPAEVQLCEAFIENGACSAGDECPYIHGDQCKSCLKFVIHPYNPDLAEHHRSSCQRDSGTATEAPPKAPPPHSSSPPADTTNADDAEQEAAQADQVAAPADQAADIPSTGDAEQKAQADQVTEQLEGVSLGSDPDKEQ